MNPRSFGIGLRQPHYHELLQTQSRTDLPIDFLEVHSENFFVDGGAALAVLEKARARYPISLHGVGLSLGSANQHSAQHLAKLKRLVERIQPALVSEHLCWGGIDGVHFNDLLPLPYTPETLNVLVQRVDHVQQTLGRQILIENLSAYVAYRTSTMSETTFLAELTQRTGCAILCDLNNLYVNAINFGFDPLPLLDELPAQAIGQVHLAGHLVTDECLIDDHGSCVIPEVWNLYRAFCLRFGARPTLIEWDTNVPDLSLLIAEVERARNIVLEVCAETVDG